MINRGSSGALARLEGEVGLRTLFERYPQPRLEDGAEVVIVGTASDEPSHRTQGLSSTMVSAKNEATKSKRARSINGLLK